ncbi:phosphonate transport system permease protein [Leucobacter luti]|uniref:Phosphonate transport system permease protein n=1 Tax=Leucobacter luti TaxID=340320 RepID=A0A4R6RV91_9MICO|nr:phosphonate ABC transporter, permease protein PhnE [Leucobacter luti]TDP90225.1 phosphonate transport system permease protein [Leucobacter luti]
MTQRSMTTPVDPAPLRAALRPPPNAQRRRLVVTALILAALFLAALWNTNFTPWNVFGRLDSIRDLLERLVPPNFTDWRRYVQAVVETLWMVTAGTAIAVVIAIPLAVCAARNTTTGPVAYNIARFVITLTRAIPSLVLALLFVRAIGVGPTAGVLAMGFSSVGMIGKFFADRIEEIDEGIVEASRATGATRLQTFVAAVLPQVASNWISLGLYRFDINLRNAVILGFVGAGGIGFELQRVLGQMVYTRVLAIALIIFVLVLLVEQLSAIARTAILGSSAPARHNPFSVRARLMSTRAPVSTSTHATSALTIPVRPARRGGPIRAGWGPDRLTRWILGWSALALILTSFLMLRLGPDEIGVALREIGPYLLGMFPPDFLTNLAPHLSLMLETLSMALAAATLGLILALPVGIIAAKNATFHPVAARLSRLLTLVVRGIPDLMLAILLVVAVGLGPLAGVLALTIGAIGFTGKLIADAIEDTDLSRTTEALDAVGARWLQRTVTSTIPTAFPAIIGAGLFTFDVFVRSATIMGVVGAGGIGLALDASIRGRQLDQTLALIIMILLTVYATERLSVWLRKQVL